MVTTTLVDRSVVRLSGDDVVGFLQGLVTNDVAGELPVWTGLLTPQGKVLFDFIVWREGDALFVDCETAATDALIRRLSIYRLRRAIMIERTDLAVHWTRTGDAGDPDPRMAALGRRWIGPATQAAEGWLQNRLNLGVVEGRGELGDGTTLWLECNARKLNGVSFTKGCYVGQENTARMHHRSKVNKRLVIVPFAKDATDIRVSYPEHGWAVAYRKITG